MDIGLEVQLEEDGDDITRQTRGLWTASELKYMNTSST